MHIRLLRNLTTNRKTLLKGSISLALAAVFLIWAPAYLEGFGNKAPAHRLSLEGYLQGTEHDTFQTDSITVDASIPGLATYLGEFNCNYNVSVNAASGSATGTGELVATNASGDSLSLSISGQGEPSDSDVPNLNSIVEIDTITGGTGRFAGARGVVTVRRLINLATGFTSGTVHGTIVLPDERHRDH